MRQHIKGEKGFSFIEALLQLLVFTVLCQLIGFIFIAIAALHEDRERRLNIDWEVAVTEIGQYVTNKQVRVSADGQIVHFDYLPLSEGRQLAILNQTLFYRQLGGLETLIANFQQAHFSLQDQELWLYMTLSSGEERRRMFVVEPLE